MIVGVDPDPANRDKIVNCARGSWDAVHPYAAGGTYVNFMMEEGTARLEAATPDCFAPAWSAGRGR